MSIVFLSDIINAIINVWQSIVQALGGNLSQISNTGQGVFAGIIGFGQVLQGVIKYWTDNFTQALNQLLKPLRDAINTLGGWLYSALQPLWIAFENAVTHIGNQIYNIGQWLWNSAQYIISVAWDILQDIWNAIMTIFEAVASSVWNWVNSVGNTINLWWTNLMKGFRAKLKETIVADLTVTIMWKQFEKIGEDFSLRQLGKALLTPIAVYTLTSIVVNMLDAMIPTPSTNPVTLIPTLPSLSVSLPRWTTNVRTPPPNPILNIGVKYISIPSPKIYAYADLQLIPKEERSLSATITSDVSVTLQ